MAALDFAPEIENKSVRKQFLQRGRIFSYLGFIAVFAALSLPVLTFFILPGLSANQPDNVETIGFLVANGLVGLILFILVLSRLFQLRRAKRNRVPGAGMHWQVASLFGIIAAVPAIAVGAFAFFTVQRGLDNWFNQRSELWLESSTFVANAYFEDYWQGIVNDLTDLSDVIEQPIGDGRSQFSLFDNVYLLGKVIDSQRNARRLFAVSILDDSGRVVYQSRVKDGILPLLPSEALKLAVGDNWVRLTPDQEGVAGAVLSLRDENSHYLVIHRAMNTKVVNELQAVERRRAEYLMLRENRFAITLTYAAVLSSLSLAFLFAALYAGLRQANNLVEPINHLALAARRISDGDLHARVIPGNKEGDIEHLGNTFNQMADKISAQQKDLEFAKRRAEARREIIEAVLASVSSGVIGFDSKLRVSLLNQAALHMFNKHKSDDVIGMNVQDFAPSIAPFLINAMKHNRSISGRIAMRTLSGERSMRLLVTRDLGSILSETIQEDLIDEVVADYNQKSVADEISDYDDHNTQSLQLQEDDSAKIKEESDVVYESESELDHPLVVTLTDVTAVEAAQRSEAWSEVARRIAHEIKNPLTPIQLAAERLHSRYRKIIPADDVVFTRCTQTIIRQVEALGTMVSEFSSYTRLPDANPARANLVELLRNSAWEAKLAADGIEIKTDLPENSVFAWTDTQQIAQVITNLINNAAEAIRRVETEDYKGIIFITLKQYQKFASISVADNGAGLPEQNRDKLFDPYITHRAKGTGLGLAIVKKIIEDHSGSFHLRDIDNDSPIKSENGTGTEAILRLPLSPPAVIEIIENNSDAASDEGKDNKLISSNLKVH